MEPLQCGLGGSILKSAYTKWEQAVPMPVIDLPHRPVFKHFTVIKLLLYSALMAFRNRIWIYETSEKSPEQIVEEIFYELRRTKKKSN